MVQDLLDIQYSLPQVGLDHGGFGGLSLPCYLLLYQRSNLQFLRTLNQDNKDTLCPRSLDQFDIVSCYLKWVDTSWTYSRALSGNRLYAYQGS